LDSSEIKSLSNASSGALLKALSEDKSAVIVAVEARALIQELGKRLGAFPPPLKHLGLGLLGASLVHALSDLQDNEKLELQWRTAGNFGHLCADVLGSGRLRGTIGQPRAEVFNFDEGLGAGLLQVRRSRKKGVPTTGVVQAKGSVVEDIVQYLQDSEQKPCALNLHVKIEWDEEAEKRGEETPFRVVQAVGYLIHVLPQDTDATRDAYADLWAQRMKVMGPLSEWAIPENSKAALRFMVDLLTVGSKPSLSKVQPLNLYCTCNEDRAKRALALLSPRERNSLLEEEATKENIELKCEYCGETYLIAVDEEAG